MKLRNAKRVGYHFCADLGAHAHSHSRTSARTHAFPACMNAESCAERKQCRGKTAKATLAHCRPN